MRGVKVKFYLVRGRGGGGVRLEFEPYFAHFPNIPPPSPSPGKVILAQSPIFRPKSVTLAYSGELNSFELKNSKIIDINQASGFLFAFYIYYNTY